MCTLLEFAITPANEADGLQIGELAQQVQEANGESIEVIYADVAYTGEETAAAAHEQRIHLVVVQQPEDSHGFVPLPKRRVVERSFAWVTRSRRLARDYELPYRDLGWAPFRRLHLSLASQTAGLDRRFITRSLSHHGLPCKLVIHRQFCHTAP